MQFIVIPQHLEFQYLMQHLKQFVTEQHLKQFVTEQLTIWQLQFKLQQQVVLKKLNNHAVHTSIWYVLLRI